MRQPVSGAPSRLGKSNLLGDPDLIRTAGVVTTGTPGADRLTGTPDDDTLSGLAGNDILRGAAGADWLDGGSDDDRLYGEDGEDLLTGGSGNDRLFGGNDADRLYGDDGNDLLIAGDGGDIARGGRGNDRVEGGAGHDSLYGDDGHDILAGDDGDDRLFGGAGRDYLDGGAGEDLLVGGDGADILHGGAQSDRLLGGEGDDNLYGEGGHDTLSGEAGADRLFGGDGHDTLNGGAGEDLLLGGIGHDVLHGGDDADRLRGEDGNDRLYGDGGSDTLSGEAGADRLFGGDGHDTLYGGTGEDLLLGGRGHDVLHGGDDADRLRGEDGNDRLYGDDGNDVLLGEGGRDELHGGAGRDTLTGGAGNDIINGGEGRDTAIFSGDFAAYSLSFSGGVLTVTGPDGIDSLTDVEWLQFDDQRVTLRLVGDSGPVFSSAIAVDAAENQTAAYLAQAVDTDAGTALLYILGGPDAALFDIDANTGSVTFRSAPDFELPGDADGDNVYDINVRAFDGANTIDQAVAITVTDVLEQTIIDFTGLTAGQGFIIQGAPLDGVGMAVSAAGDVNGDGYGDLILGAHHSDDGGQAFIVFGSASGFGSSVTAGGYDRQVLDLATLGAADGFIIQGDAAGDRFGRTLSSAGDINGDGIDDLIIGAPFGDDGGADAGEAYVVFGSTSGFGVDVSGRQVIDLSTLSAAEGFVIQGDAAGDQAGYSVSSAGDINGDGYDDLIVGAHTGDDAANNAGEAYVVFGSAAGFGSAVGGRQVIDLTALSAADGFIIQGAAATAAAGQSVSSAGDVNGDGYDDLVIGSHGDSAGGLYAGAAYVVFGSATGFGVDVSGRQVIDLASLGAAEGFMLQGDAAMDLAGASVSSAGDINGDGYDDMIVGAPGGDDGGAYAGEAYVVFGSASGFGSDVGGRQVIDLAALSAAEGFVIQGQAGALAGGSVSSAGDINGDGYDDLIVGTPRGDGGGHYAGAAYVVFGTDSGFGIDIAGRQVIDLASLTEVQGIVIQGDVANDYAGYSVSAAGDVDGDGFDDLIVGAQGGTDGGSYAGEAYVVFGAATGSTAGVVAAGTVGANRMIGAAGDDTLAGNGGADVIRGGAGNDVIGVSDTGFQRIDGGRGSDTLRLDGSGIDLDFTALAQNTVTNIERIDLTGSGDNALTLTALDVLDLTDVRVSGLAVLHVNGDAGDSLTFDDSGWSLSGTVVEDAITYNRYGNGAVEVRIEDGVAVSGADPIFTSAGTASAAENQTAAYTAIATDDHGTPPIYSLSGTDAAFFNIDSDTGAVSFKSAPDFETPGDDGTDNVYDILVTADYGGRSNDQAVAITVTNENDNSPVYPYPGTNEDRAESRFQLYGIWVGANDADGDTLTYTLSGADADIFYFSSPGNLQFRLPPDFETPLDADGDNIYEITVAASDGVHSTVKDFTVTVTDVVEPARVDTVTLNASEGFIIRGAGASDYAGLGVASAGDINGDGFEDLILGLGGDGGHGQNAGSAYVIFGTASGFGVDVDGRQVIDLGTLSASEGFIIQPGATDYYARTVVSSAGDVNGDGFDDLIIGAYYNSDDGVKAGEAVIIFGTASGFGTDVGGRQVLDIGTLGAAEGFLIVGDAILDRLGSDVSSAGDVNGDGYDDLIVGARDGDDGGPNAGEAYVVFGTGSGFGTAVGGRQVIDVTSLDAATGFIIQGDFRGDSAGRSVSSAGDINGDGFDDLVVGAPFGYDSGGTDSGEAYVIFGTDSGFGSTVTTGAYDRQVIDLTSFTPAEGFIIQGHRIGERTGYSVASAGDINGDGFDDVFVAAPGASPNGAGYVVFGSASGFGGLVSGRQVLDLTSLTAAEGFMIQGEDTRDLAGASVSSAGDINGDGFDDIIIGAPLNDTTGYASGRAYVIYGTDAGFGATYTRLGYDVDIQRIDLANLTETEGFVIEAGAARDYLGFAVSSAGDLNGDGFDDLAVSAPFNNTAGSRAGETYVIFGSANGSMAAVTTTGTAAANSIIGAAGADTLTGAGGADVIRGGAGDDVIGVSDATFARIDGGGGDDTLRLDGTGINLDFNNIAQNTVTGIERIDLTGSGNNTLSLTALDLFDMVDARTGGVAILRVNGDAGDIVNLTEGTWVSAGSVVEDTVTYDRYTLGNAEVRIESTISVPAAAVLDPVKFGGDAVVMDGLDAGLHGETVISGDALDGFAPLAVNFRGAVSLDAWGQQSGFLALDSETPWGDRDHGGLDAGLRGVGPLGHAGLIDSLADHALGLPGADALDGLVSLGEPAPSLAAAWLMTDLPATVPAEMPLPDGIIDIAFEPIGPEFEMPLPHPVEGWH